MLRPFGRGRGAESLRDLLSGGPLYRPRSKLNIARRRLYVDGMGLPLLRRSQMIGTREMQWQKEEQGWRKALKVWPNWVKLQLGGRFLNNFGYLDMWSFMSLGN